MNKFQIAGAGSTRIGDFFLRVGFSACILLVISPAARAETPIPIDAFEDSISHWAKKQGRDRKDARFNPDQTVEIADNLLRYQNRDGGWTKNIDWLADIPVEEIERIFKSFRRSTFDNHGTYSQVEYLAHAYTRTRLERFREGAERGLDYIFREQRPCGSWRGWDVEAITFNDDVMVGVLGLLLDIREKEKHFRWLDDARHEQATSAFARALEVTLDCQVEIGGVQTIWGQQHDPETLAPIAARKFEPAALSTRESDGIVRLLMRIPHPDDRVRSSVESAVRWLDQNAMVGFRLDRVPIEPVRFENHTAKYDIVLVPDSSAQRLWARFYDLGTGKPVYCDHTGARVGSLAEIDLERRTGYSWIGGWCARLLEVAYPAWKARV